MARRPLPGILSNRPALDRGRDLARFAADNATDVLHPVITITRGLRRQVSWLHRWWRTAPKDRRNTTLFITAAALFVLVLLPYGPILVAVSLMGSAAWAGRDRAGKPDGPGEAETVKLRCLYEALVPYLSAEGDPRPLYRHEGEWRHAFVSYEFEQGRLVSLRLRYPAYFTDGEAEARTRIEQLLHAKAGRGREYRFDWNEEENHLTLTALPPLPTTITAQRFVTAPGETILGFTDAATVQRTIPVRIGDAVRDAPPVAWRTGPRSAEPHLLAIGRPGSGTTTLLRSIALQALHHGDLLAIDGGGTGEYLFLSGRPGVLAVESGLAGALATLEWAAHETERRLIALSRARQAGRPAPQDTRRPLWIIVDRPTGLSQLAHAEGRSDPQHLLEVPLRHGRTAGVAVAVGEQAEALDALGPAVPQHTRARVVLGSMTAAQTRAVLGTLPHTTPAAHTPPGRGYARLGDGPVHRLQVPATPDPYDEDTADSHRQAVLALLSGAKAPTVSMIKSRPT
ncbi:hypothetical protein ACWGCW_38210 [Streptomyces sp. NPDC054933]